MSVKFTARQIGDVTIVDMDGRLTLGEGTSAMRTKLREIVHGGSRRIVLNMADVSYIDSSGLGELVSAHTTTIAVGGQIKLLNLGKRAHDLLKITKLYTVFETFEDEDSAMRSFLVTNPTAVQIQAG